ncbi:hypothetical protein RclHR1_00230018 [Rhizophagus clarus]|uniref:F-box domain-containing protein n=1 Tax=Rhizophagus clarus TaxID=94130 RepID=A0A2Z6QVZ9_9GLOM|nr:hypothetical protein RclHR1_00230018 [Rhizophagus clarus]GES72923.1 hypothetical protein GLOIN_2v1885543 [Rhizophagus clarus]
MTRYESQVNKRKEKSSSSNKKPRLVRVGSTWQRKEIKEVNIIDIIENKPKRLVRNGNMWKRIVPSKNETVSPQQNISIDTKIMRLSNLEPLKGESGSLKRMFDLIDNENSSSNEQNGQQKSSKKFKISIENNLYRYKLSQNTFLPVGFQIAEEILGYLDVEDLISVSLTYKPIHKFITNSENLWQGLYQKLSPESINYIMKILIMIQSLASPELKPSVAWKRQVFNRLKYRPFYLAFTYLDDPNDFIISFPGVSYDLSTVQIEAYQYAIYEEEEILSPANFVQHNTQIFDSLQEGFDEWRIAIEPIKTDLTKPLKLKDNDELFIVYNYMNINSIFQFNFLKLFDNVIEAIKLAESLSDLNDDDDYIKNINHSGKIFDCKQKFIKGSRIAVDIVKFWSKIHQNRNLPNTFIEKKEEEDTDDDADGSTNFIEKWRQMGLMDKTYIQEVIDDIINKSNQKKRSFKDSMLDESSSSRNGKRKK